MFNFFRSKPSAPPRKPSRAPEKALNGFDSADADALWRTGIEQDVEAGAVLMPAGAEAGRAFLVLDGAVKAVAAVGAKRVVVGSHHAGDWVGALGAQRSPLAVVAGSAARVLALDPARWALLPARLQAAITESLLRSQAQHVQFITDALSDMAGKNLLLATEIQRSAGPSKEAYLRCEMIGGILDSIPRLPVYATQLLSLLKDSDASVKEIVSLAEQDPSLAAETLKVVNSAQYGLEGDVTDIHHAIMLLGFNQVHKLVIATGIKRVMPDEPEFNSLRDHALVLSQVAYELAKLLRHEDAAMLGTVGLLQNTGKSILLLLKRKNPKFELLVDLLDHPRLGALLLERWKLPAPICSAIEYQRHPAFTPSADLPEHCRTNVAVLYVSNLVIDALRGESGERLTGLFVEDYLKLLDPPTRNIGELARQIRPLLSKRLPGWQRLLPPAQG